MIIVINGKHYPHVAIEDLSLSHVMALQRELTVTNISSCKTWGDVQRMVTEFGLMKPPERKNHPEILFLTALTVWAARVTAGERLELLDAVDVPLSQIKFIAEPHDRQEPDPNPKARSRRKASAPGDAPQPDPSE